MLHRFLATGDVSLGEQGGNTASIELLARPLER